MPLSGFKTRAFNGHISGFDGHMRTRQSIFHFHFIMRSLQPKTLWHISRTRCARAVFKLAVKSNYTIATLRDRPKKSRVSYSTNEKQTINKSHFVRTIFCGALGKVPVTTWNSDWVIAKFTSVLIGRSFAVCNIDFFTPFLQDLMSGCYVLSCSHLVHGRCLKLMRKLR